MQGLPPRGRVLRDAEVLRSLSSWVRPPTALCVLAAVENSAAPQSSSARTRGTPTLGQQYGRERSWPLVPGFNRHSACVAFECLLQIAWPSIIHRGLTA